MFAWNLVKLPAVMAAEAEAARKALEAQQETVEQRRQKRELIGQFLAEGIDLQERVAKNDPTVTEEYAQEWLNRAAAYIEVSLGRAYIARMTDSSVVPIAYTSGKIKNTELWSGIRAKVFHLQQFVRELA